MHNMNDPTTEIWDRFWQADRGACCLDPGQQSYNESFRAPWLAFLAELDGSSSILDLCTGNGAVLLIAAECSESFDLHGVDSADIDPPRYNAGFREVLQNMTFYPHTSVTALPFGNAQFDAVTSQYGIEYAPLDAASAEAVRVLKPGGRGRFITHAADGVTVKQAARELADIDDLLHQEGVFDAASDALQLVHPIEEATDKPDAGTVAAAQAAYGAFNAKLATLGDTWQERAAAAVFQSTGSILQHTFLNRRHFPLAALLEKVRETQQAVEQHRDRLQLLRDSALTEEDCESMRKTFAELGCSASDLDAIHDVAGENLLGWCVTIRK